MTDGSQHSWLIRAGAEFLVIVVGVLLALAVNQWVSDRADRAMEREYLSALATDLRVDSTVYRDILEPSLSRALPALDEVSRVLKGSAQLTTDSLGFLQTVLWSSSYVSQFETRRATYEELVATGRLQIILSSEVRSQIVAYYDQLRLTTTLSEARASGYTQLVTGYLPFEEDEALDDQNDGIDTRAALAVISAPELLPALNRHSRLVRFQLSQLQELTQRVNQLLRLVDQEVRR